MGRWDEGPAPQPPANPRIPAAPGLKEVPKVARRRQSGRRGPVLTKPTGTGAGKHGPAGPGAPAGVRGRGNGGGEPRRRRRRTPGGAVNPARRSRSRASGRTAHARPVGRTRSAGARPSCRGREVRAPPAGIWCRVLPTAAALLGTGEGWRGVRHSAAALACPAPSHAPGAAMAPDSSVKHRLWALFATSNLPDGLGARSTHARRSWAGCRSSPRGL